MQVSPVHEPIRVLEPLQKVSPQRHTHNRLGLGRVHERNRFGKGGQRTDLVGYAQLLKNSKCIRTDLQPSAYLLELGCLLEQIDSHPFLSQSQSGR